MDILTCDEWVTWEGRTWRLVQVQPCLGWQEQLLEAFLWILFFGSQSLTEVTGGEKVGSVTTATAKELWCTSETEARDRLFCHERSPQSKASVTKTASAFSIVEVFYRSHSLYPRDDFSVVLIISRNLYPAFHQYNLQVLLSSQCLSHCIVGRAIEDGSQR